MRRLMNEIATYCIGAWAMLSVWDDYGLVGVLGVLAVAIVAWIAIAHVWLPWSLKRNRNGE